MRYTHDEWMNEYKGQVCWHDECMVCGRRLDMTLTQARQELNKLGIRLTYSREWNEYRVSIKGSTAPEVYYTSDLDDAVATGKAMARL